MMTINNEEGVVNMQNPLDIAQIATEGIRVTMDVYARYQMALAPAHVQMGPLSIPITYPPRWTDLYAPMLPRCPAPWWTFHFIRRTFLRSHGYIQNGTSTTPHQLLLRLLPRLRPHLCHQFLPESRTAPPNSFSSQDQELLTPQKISAVMAHMREMRTTPIWLGECHISVLKRNSKKNFFSMHHPN
ncbi:hypothetical protein FXO37_25733 [Capsicum annuum]|nr:hypothetical protein FXO37_25733 [Capsicum annuum]